MTHPQHGAAQQIITPCACEVNPTDCWTWAGGCFIHRTPALCVFHMNQLMLNMAGGRRTQRTYSWWSRMSTSPASASQPAPCSTATGADCFVVEPGNPASSACAPSCSYDHACQRSCCGLVSWVRAPDDLHPASPGPQTAAKKCKCTNENTIANKTPCRGEVVQHHLQRAVRAQPLVR